MSRQKSQKKSFASYFLKGILFSFGLFFTFAIVAVIGFLLYQSGYRPENLISKARSVSETVLFRQTEVKPLKDALNFTALQNPYLNKEFKLPTIKNQVFIHSAEQLLREITNANKSPIAVMLTLSEGVYTLDRTINITGDNIVLTSLSGLPEDVIIQGGILPNSGIGNILRVSGKNFILSGITLRNARNHLVQIAGESDADFPVIRDCILQDAYQQLIKVSYDRDRAPDISSDWGLIENCRLEYTEGIGPNFYIGGIDVIAGNGWIIRNNKLKDIASPFESLAQYAIHIWTNASNTLVENNIIEDCDRGIGFGLGHGSDHPAYAYSHRGGVIRNNLILHTNNDNPFSDVGIGLENSPGSIVIGNRIWLGGNYPNAIEYRFPSTRDVIISNNITNKAIRSRNGGEAELSDNITDARLDDILIGHEL
jgi:hypothetical protein